MSKERFNQRARRFRYFWEAIAVIGLVGLFLLVQWLVNTFQKPSHMGVIESQSMDMTVHPPEGAMPVATEIIQPRPFAASVTYTGSAAAYNDIPIYPRVEGRIVAMKVYPGDRVRAGQLLAQLDSQELASRVSEAQAGQAAATQQYYASVRQQSQASAQMQRAQQAIASAKASLQFRQAQVQRSRTLVNEDVITREEAQQDEADYTTAQSQYQQALAELRAAQQGASAATFQSKAQRNQARQASAAVQTQRIIRGYSSIIAPSNGVITQRLAAPGTLVSPGMQILQLSQIHPIRIQANVAEGDLRRIRIGNSVTIWAQKNQSGGSVTGKVSAIFPRADLQTRTAVVEAVIDNSDNRFIPGDFVAMAIQTGTASNVLTVINSALVDQGGQQAVWILQDGKAHLQFVTTGDTNGNRTAIVNGLKAGDTVITQGNQNLTEGAMVTQAEYGPQGLKALPKTVAGNRLADANHYRIHHAVGMYTTSVTLTSPPPRIGQNTLTVEVTSMPGMAMPLGNVSVDMTMTMPSMPTMSVPKPRTKKVGDGRFDVDAMLGMPGLYEVTVTVQDGGKTQGTFPVEIEVPQ